MATKDTILTFLAQCPRTTQYLMLITGKTYAAVHTSLRRLSRAGKVFEDPSRPNTWSTAPYVGQLPVPARVSKGRAPARTPATSPPPAPTPPPLPQTATYAQAQKVAAQVPQRRKRIKAILVVDDSGSVISYRHEMNASINKTIADLKAEAYRFGIAIEMSLYYFSGFSTKPAFRHVDVRDVKPEGLRWPDGGTPLFSAVEDAINDHLKPEAYDEDVSYLVTVITDGDDNQSRDRSGNTMKDLIRRVQGTDRWTIAFEMPPGTKNKFCNTYGIHPGNCVEWELSGRGVQETTVRRTAAVQNYTASVSKGTRSMSTFYTDLSGVNVNDLKKNLANLQDQVKTFQVAAEADIRPFIEAKTGLPYEAGSVFYQLTKPETIQDTKKLLIKEKNGRAMFGGAEARKLLGLPQGQDCRVRPGNHGNFDLFVQSTSVNRKLVRGTTVVHWPLALQ